MRYLFVLSVLLSYCCMSQNLVPNPGFEAYETCTSYYLYCDNLTPYANKPCYSTCCVYGLPRYPNDIVSGTKNWWNVSRDKYFSTVNAPIYFNACNVNTWKQYQAGHGYPANMDWYAPRTGGAYILIRTYGDWNLQYLGDTDTRDYAQVRLTDPLKAGCTYEASCYVIKRSNFGNPFISQIHDTKQCADGFGFYFSKDSVYRTDAVVSYKAMTDIIPQVSNPAGHILSDSVHYQKVSGIFTAQGGEEWLVLGNFEDNAHTQALYDNLGIAVYAIDDVSVQEWKPNLISFADTTLCIDRVLVVKLPEGLKNYKWSTGETTQQISILADGVYTVEATNGCTILRDTFIRKSIAPYTDFTLGKDSFFCKIPASYELKPNHVFDQYSWSTGAATNNIKIQSPGKYWLQGKYACGTLSDTIVITEFQPPSSIILPATDTTICSNETITLETTTALPLHDFLWNDGNTSNTLTARAAGEYSIKAYSAEGCLVTDTIHIQMIYPPAFNKIKDTIACNELPVTEYIRTNKSNTVQWYDGSHAWIHTLYNSGDYWVDVSNRCYRVRDTFQVRFLDCSLTIPNLITVNGDDKNETFEIDMLVKRSIHVVLYNSWGDKVYENTDYKDEWNADNLNAGIYFYHITESLQQKKYNGWVQVIK